MTRCYRWEPLDLREEKPNRFRIDTEEINVIFSRLDNGRLCYRLDIDSYESGLGEIVYYPSSRRMFVKKTHADIYQHKKQLLAADGLKDPYISTLRIILNKVEKHAGKKNPKDKTLKTPANKILQALIV